MPAIDADTPPLTRYSRTELPDGPVYEPRPEQQKQQEAEEGREDSSLPSAASVNCFDAAAATAPNTGSSSTSSSPASVSGARVNSTSKTTGTKANSGRNEDSTTPSKFGSALHSTEATRRLRALESELSGTSISRQITALKTLSKSLDEVDSAVIEQRKWKKRSKYDNQDIGDEGEVQCASSIPASNKIAAATLEESAHVAALQLAELRACYEQALSALDLYELGSAVQLGEREPAFEERQSASADRSENINLQNFSHPLGSATKDKITTTNGSAAVAQLDGHPTGLAKSTSSTDELLRAVLPGAGREIATRSNDSNYSGKTTSDVNLLSTGGPVAAALTELKSTLENAMNLIAVPDRNQEQVSKDLQMKLRVSQSPVNVEKPVRAHIENKTKRVMFSPNSAHAAKTTTATNAEKTQHTSARSRRSRSVGFLGDDDESPVLHDATALREQGRGMSHAKLSRTVSWSDQPRHTSRSRSETVVQNPLFGVQPLKALTNPLLPNVPTVENPLFNDGKVQNPLFDSGKVLLKAASEEAAAVEERQERGVKSTSTSRAGSVRGDTLRRFNAMNTSGGSVRNPLFDKGDMLEHVLAKRSTAGQNSPPSSFGRTSHSNGTRISHSMDNNVKATKATKSQSSPLLLKSNSAIQVTNPLASFAGQHMARAVDVRKPRNKAKGHAAAIPGTSPSATSTQHAKQQSNRTGRPQNAISESSRKTANSSSTAKQRHQRRRSSGSHEAASSGVAVDQWLDGGSDPEAAIDNNLTKATNDNNLTKATIDNNLTKASETGDLAERRSFETLFLPDNFARENLSQRQALRVDSTGSSGKEDSQSVATASVASGTTTDIVASSESEGMTDDDIDMTELRKRAAERRARLAAILQEA